MTNTGTFAEKPFDKYENLGAYHWQWYETNKGQYKDKIHLVLAHLPTSGSVIDIGGGDGLLSYRMFVNGLDVTCIDNNSVSIELARQTVSNHVYGHGIMGSVRKVLSQYDIKRNNLIRRYESERIQFHARSFDEMTVAEPYDFAVCHEVIEHVPDPVKLMDWIMGNIKQYAIISTPDISNHPPHELDYNSWTPETFSQFLSPFKFDFILRDGWNMYVKVYKQ